MKLCSSLKQLPIFIFAVFLMIGVLIDDTSAQTWESASPPSQPAHSSSSIRARGSGVETNDPNMSPAEKALMAKRAAKLDALRNLAEEVYGVKITSDSYVRDFVLQSDDTRSRVNTFIQGARVVSEQKMPDGSYQVEVELDTEPLRGILGINK